MKIKLKNKTIRVKYETEIEQQMNIWSSMLNAESSINNYFNHAAFNSYPFSTHKMIPLKIPSWPLAILCGLL